MLVIVLSFVVELLTLQSLSNAKLRFICHINKVIFGFFSHYVHNMCAEGYSSDLSVTI